MQEVYATKQKQKKTETERESWKRIRSIDLAGVPVWSGGGGCAVFVALLFLDLISFVSRIFLDNWKSRTKQQRKATERKRYCSWWGWFEFIYGWRRSEKVFFLFQSTHGQSV